MSPVVVFEDIFIDVDPLEGHIKYSPRESFLEELVEPVEILVPLLPRLITPSIPVRDQLIHVVRKPILNLLLLVHHPVPVIMNFIGDCVVQIVLSLNLLSLMLVLFCTMLEKFLSSSLFIFISVLLFLLILNFL